MPGHPDLALASMGIYVFATDVMYELLFQDAARKEASGHDFGRDIIPAMLGRLPGLRLPVPRREPQAGRLLARRRHARRLLPDQHGPDPDRPDPEPLRPRLADPHLPAADAPAQVRPHRPRPPGRRVQLDRLPGGDRLRRPGLPEHPLARACGSTASPWSRTRSSSTASRSAATPGSAARSSTRTCKVPPGFDDRLEPRGRPRPRPDRHRGGRHRRRQGRGPRTVRRAWGLKRRVRSLRGDGQRGPPGSGVPGHGMRLALS